MSLTLHSTVRTTSLVPSPTPSLSLAVLQATKSCMGVGLGTRLVVLTVLCNVSDIHWQCMSLTIIGIGNEAREQLHVNTKKLLSELGCN